MAENKVSTENNQVEQPKKGNAGAAVKEWGRKQIVSLKRAPQRIPLVYLVLVTGIWLIWLFTFSKAIYATSAATWTGIAVFVNTLLSILLVALFLSAFPKRKKANKVFIGLLFAFMVAIILCDVLYYVQESGYLAEQDASFMERNPFLQQSLTLAIVHMVLVGIGAVLLATLPLYSKLIMKINTRKEIEMTTIKEKIDVEDE